MEEEIEALVGKVGVFPIGGPGTYIFEGKTGSGKNFLLNFFLCKAKGHLNFSNVISLSSTQAEAGSLDFLAKLYDPEYWAQTKTQKELMGLIETRKRHCAKIKESQGKEEVEKFVLRNPLLVIVDDMGGKTNTTTSLNNEWYNTFTTVRHLGIYLVMLIQYHKQIGPAYVDNTRALITFASNATALKHFSECCGMTLNKHDTATVQGFLRTRFNFLLWWRNWLREDNLPDLPWLIKKIDPEKPIININGLTYGANLLNLDNHDTINGSESEEFDESENSE